MWRLQYIAHHPIAWAVYCALIGVILYKLGMKKIGVASLVVGIVIGCSLIPTVSQYWLQSVAVLTNQASLLCEELPGKSAIALPAGYVWKGGKFEMTEWSAVRAEAVATAINNNDIEELYIPGGYQVGNMLEGERLRQDILKLTNKEIEITVGSGSDSTLGNFEELEPLLNKNEKYKIFTSDWHGYRASQVAKKLSLQVCLANVKNKFESKSFLLSAWRFRNAVREYLAIAWYLILGRI